MNSEPKMLHFKPNYFFHNRNLSTKNADEPLQLLGSIPTPVRPQMLHWCNILSRIFMKFPVGTSEHTDSQKFA